MKATILIRCLNEVENLKILFPILESQNNKNFEVVFIDSGSSDGSFEFVQNYKSIIPIILTKIDKQNFSFGRSLNRAAEKSSYKDILISLSAHCFPTNKSWLDNMLSAFSETSIDIVYGRQIGDDKSRLSESSHLNSWFGPDSKIKDSPFTNNGNAAFRYSVWDKYKFNESLTGCEDIDFAKKTLNAEKDIFYTSEGSVRHFHDEDFNQIKNRYRRESQAIKIIFNDEIDFSLKDVLINLLKESYSDIKYRKNKPFPSADIQSIIKYRFSKNIGQYLGINRPINSNENMQNKYYSYRDVKDNVKAFKKDYYYK